jgi:hypothetical protein
VSVGNKESLEQSDERFPAADSPATTYDSGVHRLRNLGSQMTVPIPTDEHGYLGRECPEAACEGHFKVTPGTGLQGVPCHCPYCGHEGGSDKFFTKEQIEYARSVVINKVTGALLADLKELERHSVRGGFVRMEIRVSGEPHPIRYYRERQLETELVCDSCSLRYAIYGLFAFCPDCGAHNSRQILDKNLVLAGKELDLATSVEEQLAEHLVGDALENVVSAFDGFARQLCKVNAARASNPTQAAGLSFQNLAGAQKNVLKLFGADLAAGLTPAEWDAAIRGFQKRHLLAHAMGVIDAAYIQATQDPTAVLGRKVSISRNEVLELVSLVKRIADGAALAIA